MTAVRKLSLTFSLTANANKPLLVKSSVQLDHKLTNIVFT
jgi:hypothetical protein